jgi:hypothetical protein
MLASCLASLETRELTFLIFAVALAAIVGSNWLAAYPVPPKAMKSAISAITRAGEGYLNLLIMRPPK